jgi:hypothetical protein
LTIDAIRRAYAWSFSAERAMRHVEVIARRPHPAGSAAHDTVRDHLATQLEPLGMDVALQHGTATGWN